MKTLLMTLLMLLVASVASAETWHKVNQATAAWDQPATLENGESIPAQDVIRYDVYLKDKRTGVETKIANNILERQYTITVPAEAMVWIGVQALRYVSVDGLIPDGEEPYRSDFAWSSNPADCLNNETFGLRNHVPPGKPTGLRAVQ